MSRDVGEADAARESGQDVGEVLDGVDVGERAAAQHCVGDGRAFATGVTAREEKVLPRQGCADVGERPPERAHHSPA